MPGNVWNTAIEVCRRVALRRQPDKHLGLIEQTLRNWVKAAAAGRLNGAGAKVVTPEQMELSRLRAEHVRLKRENDILKNATAYVARDTR